MWRPPDAVDAAVGLVDHLGQGSPGTVGQLDGLEAGPQPLEGDQAQLREEVRGSNPLSSTLWN